MIKQIASDVGLDHTVDLKNYELLIIVEIYQVSSLFSAEIRPMLKLSRISAESASSTTASKG